MAIARAIDCCKRNGILADFWQLLTQEELNMLASEWNMEDALEVRFEEGVETVAERALRKGYPLNDIQDLTGLSLERLRELMSATTTSTSGR
jgi:hypothetical protein